VQRRREEAVEVVDAAEAEHLPAVVEHAVVEGRTRRI
jgi:hypothetical protein